MFGRVSCRDLATRASGQNLVFFGAPGVGKGTFAARIAPMLQIPAISTGDIMRAEIKGETELGAKVKVSIYCTCVCFPDQCGVSAVACAETARTGVHRQRPAGTGRARHKYRTLKPLRENTS